MAFLRTKISALDSSEMLYFLDISYLAMITINELGERLL